MMQMDKIKATLFGKNRQSKSTAQVTMSLALIVTCITFYFLTDGVFLTARNISNLFVQTSYTGILAAGVVLVIVAGHIDLSIGSLVGMIAAIMARLMVTYHWSTMATLAVGLAVGLLIGLFQGYVIAYRNVPAYVVTLAGWLTWRGVCMAVTGGFSLGPMPELFKKFGQGYVPSPGGMSFNITALCVGIVVALVMVALRFRRRKVKISYGLEVTSVFREILICIGICILTGVVTFVFAIHMGVPYSVVILLVVVLVLHFVSTKTVFGRHVFAYGSNREAANLSGINTKKTNLLIYVIMGLLCSIAAVILTARLNSCTASTGTMLEMDVIAAAIIGGTSTLGGEGSVVGAIVGALFMASLDNGMSLLNMSSAYQYIVKGAVLLFAVWMDVENRKRSETL